MNTQNSILTFAWDVINVNDPLNCWGKSDRYKQIVHYTRLLLLSGCLAAGVVLVTTVSLSVQNARYINYMQLCQAADHSPAECKLRWTEMERSRQR